MAVNACIAELRQHGAEINCRAEFVKGKRRFYYTMIKEPKA